MKKAYSLILMATILIFSGCKTAEEVANRKDERARIRIEKIAAKRPLAIADICRKKFDNTDSISRETEYKQGKESVSTTTGTDTLRVHDTINDVEYVYITKTVEKITNKTDTFRDKTYQKDVNKAQEEYLQGKWDREKEGRAADLAKHNKDLAKKDDKISRLETKNKMYLSVIRAQSGILLGIFLGFCVWLYIKFRKKTKIV